MFNYISIPEASMFEDDKSAIFWIILKQEIMHYSLSNEDDSSSMLSNTISILIILFYTIFCIFE